MATHFNAGSSEILGCFVGEINRIIRDEFGLLNEEVGYYDLRAPFVPNP